jgi:hypothetical protein
MIKRKKNVSLAWDFVLNGEFHSSSYFNSLIANIKLGNIDTYPTELIIRAKLFA